MSQRKLLLVAALGLLGAACGQDEGFDPASASQGGAPGGNAGTGAAGAGAAGTGAVGQGGGAGSGGVAGAGGSGGGGPVLRTVERRSPLGDSDPNNLMVDGGFELSDRDGQYGWLGLSRAGLAVETGGLCRTGLTCGRLNNRVSLFGQAVAAPEGPMSASLYSRPADGDCSQVEAFVIPCQENFVVAELVSVGEADEAGWCEHRAAVPIMATQPCVYVQTDSTDQILIDDVSLVGNLSSSAQLSLPALTVGSGLLGRIATAQEEARRRRRYGRPAFFPARRGSIYD